MNEVASRNEALEAKHDHEFDSDDGSDEIKSQNARYKFQICGRRLKGLAKSELTFWDLKNDEESSFQFFDPPQLIYDNGLVYFKYENRTVERYAIVKLECSYEESISSNSNDLELFRSRLNQVILDVDNKKSLAFVLWKSPYACNRGANQVNF